MMRMEPAPVAAPGDAQGAYDERYEYAAPRFYDFGKGTPDGDELDGWFDTTATEGGCRAAQQPPLSSASGPLPLTLVCALPPPLQH